MPTKQGSTRRSDVLRLAAEPVNRTIQFLSNWGREIFLIVLYCVATPVLWATSEVTGLTRREEITISAAMALADLTFVFFSRILRRLKSALDLYTDSVRRNPRSLLEGKVNNLTLRAIDEAYSRDLERATAMIHQRKCVVDRAEWYLETTRLCRALEGLRGEFMAISTYNITDFIRNPDAKKYLAANRDLMCAGTRVRRLFIIDDPDDLQAGDTRRVLDIHAKQLKPPADVQVQSGGESGVKWILRQYAGEDSEQDFALFYPYLVVRQFRVGAQLELNEAEVDYGAATRVFHSLWNNEHAKLVSELPKRKR